MSSSIAQNIEALCQEQGIERDLVIDAMKEAVRAAAKKQFRMGEEIQDYKKFALPRPKNADGVLKGIVLRVDAFGNLVTNLRHGDLPPRFPATLNGREIARYARSYSEGPVREPFFISGSAGFIEISMKNASAAEFLKASVGDRLIFSAA